LRYEGIGTVEIAMRDENNDKITIVMSDVLYISQLRENLLSTTTLMKKDYKVIQQNDIIVIMDKEANSVLTCRVVLMS